MINFPHPVDWERNFAGRSFGRKLPSRDRSRAHFRLSARRRSHAQHGLDSWRFRENCIVLTKDGIRIRPCDFPMNSSATKFSILLAISRCRESRFWATWSPTAPDMPCIPLWCPACYGTAALGRNHARRRRFPVSSGTLTRSRRPGVLVASSYPQLHKFVIPRSAATRNLLFLPRTMKQERTETKIFHVILSAGIPLAF